MWCMHECGSHRGPPDVSTADPPVGLHGMDNEIVGLWCHAPSKTMRGHMV
jgi:hypothetical protein